MKYTKQQIKDLEQIMGMDESMFYLFPAINPRDGIMSPWGKKFPNVIKQLRLRKNMTVVDLACGQGGYSIPAAKKYKVNVRGYDIVPAFVRYANKNAKKMGAEKFCRFRLEDIRDVVKKKNICDVLFWIGAPHVWGKAKSNLKALRNCVKNNGLIIIADVYLYPGIKNAGPFKKYEDIKSMRKGFVYFGDKIVKKYDYKSTLWNWDGEMTKGAINAAIKKVKSLKDKNKLKQYLDSIDEFENQMKKMAGAVIWILKIKK